MDLVRCGDGGPAPGRSPLTLADPCHARGTRDRTPQERSGMFMISDSCPHRAPAGPWRHSRPACVPGCLTGRAPGQAVGAVGADASRELCVEQQMPGWAELGDVDRMSTRLNSSHRCISYAVFCL